MLIRVRPVVMLRDLRSLRLFRDQHDGDTDGRPVALRMTGNTGNRGGFRAHQDVKPGWRPPQQFEAGIRDPERRLVVTSHCAQIITERLPDLRQAGPQVAQPYSESCPQRRWNRRGRRRAGRERSRGKCVQGSQAISRTVCIEYLWRARDRRTDKCRGRFVVPHAERDHLEPALNECPPGTAAQRRQHLLIVKLRTTKVPHSESAAPGQNAAPKPRGSKRGTHPPKLPRVSQPWRCRLRRDRVLQVRWYRGRFPIATLWRRARRELRPTDYRRSSKGSAALRPGRDRLVQRVNHRPVFVIQPRFCRVGRRIADGHVYTLVFAQRQRLRGTEQAILVYRGERFRRTPVMRPKRFWLWSGERDSNSRPHAPQAVAQLL